MSDELNNKWHQQILQYKIQDPFLRLIVERYEREIPWDSNVRDENTLNSYIMNTMLSKLRTKVPRLCRKETVI
jgi:hypothetical protein